MCVHVCVCVCACVRACVCACVRVSQVPLSAISSYKTEQLPWLRWATSMMCRQVVARFPFGQVSLSPSFLALSLSLFSLARSCALGHCRSRVFCVARHSPPLLEPTKRQVIHAPFSPPHSVTHTTLLSPVCCFCRMLIKQRLSSRACEI